MKRYLIPGLALTLALTGCKNFYSPQLPADDLTLYTEGLPFEMAQVSRPVFNEFSERITEYGARGDGHYDNTEEFNFAMRRISERGGGHLIVPRGVWLTGPITFQDNIDLHLQEGAVILFSGDYSKYPIVDTYFEGLKTRRCISPLNANGKKNIAITGFGTIDGHGDAWRWIKHSKLTEGQWNALLKQGGVTGVAQGSEVWAPTQSILDELRRCDMNVPTWCQTD